MRLPGLVVVVVEKRNLFQEPLPPNDSLLTQKLSPGTERSRFPEPRWGETGLLLRRPHSLLLTALPAGPPAAPGRLEIATLLHASAS